MSRVKTDDQEEHSEPRRHPGPTRHAKIMRGVVTPIFGLLAVACIVFGILNSTIWKPSPSINAKATVQDTRYLLVDPGVLDLVDNAVTVSVDGGDEARATTDQTDQGNQQDAADTDVDTTCIAIGSAKDAAGWLSGESYVRITGLETWEQLSTSDKETHGTASQSENQVKFADSDMWTKTACGNGTAELSLEDATSSEVALVDFGTSVPDATITMHWIRQDIPNFAMPWYFAGGLLAVLAVLCASLFAMEPLGRRKRGSELPEEPVKRKSQPEEVGIGEAFAGSLSKLKPTRSKHEPGRPRRRHARGHEEDGQDTPTVVDPSSRNMVAERARTAESGTANDETTSVITPDELTAYFARLAQEVGTEDATAGGDAAVAVVTDEATEAADTTAAGATEDASTELVVVEGEEAHDVAEEEPGDETSTKEPKQ